MIPMNGDNPTSRVPAGVPTGGQFAASAKDEAAIDITGGSRAAAAGEMAAYRNRLDTDEQRLFDILLAPNWTTAQGTDEVDAFIAYSEFGGIDNTGVGFVPEAYKVANALTYHYDDECDIDGDGSGSMEFHVLTGSKGGADLYTVGITLGRDGTLTDRHSTGFIIDERDVRGMDAAMGYARVIDADFQARREAAHRLGLLRDDVATSPAHAPGSSACPQQHQALCPVEGHEPDMFLS